MTKNYGKSIAPTFTNIGIVRQYKIDIGVFSSTANIGDIKQSYVKIIEKLGIRKEFVVYKNYIKNKKTGGKIKFLQVKIKIGE